MSLYSQHFYDSDHTIGKIGMTLISLQDISEDNDHLSSQLPTINEIEKIPHLESDVSRRAIALAKLIRSAKKHARGSKTLNYLMQASDTMDALLTHMNMNPESVYQRSLKIPTSVCPEKIKDGYSIRSDYRKLSENFEKAKTFISNGHWWKGCYQSVYRNFTLKYKEGYDESFQGCMYCDYSKGPFLSSTKYIKRNSFQDLNEDGGLFEDWFLRVYQKGEEGIVCPDSMFDTIPNPVSSESWNLFLDIWNLFQIRIPGGITVRKRCGKKESSSSPSKAMSFCKYLDTTEAVKVVMRSCEEVRMICELQEGTTLGAVKMEKTIPWDIDYDIRFITNNCSVCKKLADKFKKNGMSYGDFVTPCCNKVLKLGEINYVGVGYIHIWASYS
ncbi:uncharacterized protein LOC132752724 [Ruditapes philippinarum]|uniref:uncharacterized protein LOC132752724 n=1 Tax=Ruditapes philippinarum TaxID=129788 RepID=UPI00295AC5A8|nr:uncharacterized protein LOC132752724 [Ruditapes philippinarum]